MGRFTYTPFVYETPPEMRGRSAGTYAVTIVGGGPVGLAAAIDCALHGIPCVVLDDNNVVSVGSRAICWSKRTLEIFDRLGVGERMIEKGINWNVGHIYHRDVLLYSFNLLPEDGHKMPAFVNLQQYYVEQFLVERCADFPDLIDLRWKNRVTRVTSEADVVSVSVSTPDGDYSLKTRYLIACDGARSTIRSGLNLNFIGQAFEEHFLITDVAVRADLPSDRRFWFAPPFHQGQSALLHKQPDNIYRVDLQLGDEADAERELDAARIVPRIEAIFGKIPFEIEWASLYTFQCSRLEQFVHRRVIFAGDSAHVVSPFGARGGNGGIQDVDNLIWKMAAILKGEAPEDLLGSYNDERVHGAEENIISSSRATSFMTPKSQVESLFREAVLGLAADLPFARRLINSGRLSVPCSLADFPLQTPSPQAKVPAGMAAIDAPLRSKSGDTWLLNLIGTDFAIVSFGDAPDLADSGVRQVRVSHSFGNLIDQRGYAFNRYGEGMTYLFRPDQHVAAAFNHATVAQIHAARERALGKSLAARGEPDGRRQG